MPANRLQATQAALLALCLALTALAALGADPRYRIEVAGLACPFCAYGIEKQLRGLDGVAAVRTHIREGAVIVTMHEGVELERARAERAVEAAGFTLNGFERLGGGEGGAR